jgi:prepilin-type processing-associated H-X9-DG protein
MSAGQQGHSERLRLSLFDEQHWSEAGQHCQPLRSDHWWTNRTGDANFLMCDGSVQFLNYAADRVLSARCTRNDSEIVALPF